MEVWYSMTRGLRPTSFAICAWVSRLGSSISGQQITKCAAVMWLATKPQPSAGQGHGSVEMQYQPSKS